MIYPVVKQMVEATEPERVRVRVSTAARVLGFSKQAYYKWRANPVSARQAQDAQVVKAIYQIHDDDPEFGYRLICDELHDRGIAISERRCWRLCSENQVFSTTLRRYRSKKGGGQVAKTDLVNRDFTAAGPNQLWLSDITEHHTSQGKLYLCAVKDVWSNRIVGWSISERMKSTLAVAALNDAWNRRGRPRCVVIHSDRGTQYGSRAFIKACRDYKLHRSMGQARTCADNAAMESFFSLLQKNVFNQRAKWTSKIQLRLAIISWIEGKYNRKRRQRRLGKLSPVEYEIINAKTYQLAA